MGQPAVAPGSDAAADQVSSLPFDLADLLPSLTRRAEPEPVAEVKPPEPEEPAPLAIWPPPEWVTGEGGKPTGSVVTAKYAAGPGARPSAKAMKVGRKRRRAPLIALLLAAILGVLGFLHFHQHAAAHPPAHHPVVTHHHRKAVGRPTVGAGDERLPTDLDDHSSAVL